MVGNTQSPSDVIQFGTIFFLWFFFYGWSLHSSLCRPLVLCSTFSWCKPQAVPWASILLPFQLLSRKVYKLCISTSLVQWSEIKLIFLAVQRLQTWKVTDTFPFLESLDSYIKSQLKSLQSLSSGICGTQYGSDYRATLKSTSTVFTTLLSLGRQHERINPELQPLLYNLSFFFWQDFTTYLKAKQLVVCQTYHNGQVTFQRRESQLERDP